MEIRDKIVIRDKESANIPLKSLVAKLKWKTAIDLDLYAFYQTKNKAKGRIFFGSKGTLNASPYISLDRDDGVGDVGGSNEETMRIKDLSAVDHILIVANIYAKHNAIFADYDGSVSVTSEGKEFEVLLTSKTPGSWCIIAHVDNTNAITPVLKNINLTIKEPPGLELFLNGYYSSNTQGGFTPRYQRRPATPPPPPREEKKVGFFGRLFGRGN